MEGKDVAALSQEQAMKSPEMHSADVSIGVEGKDVAALLQQALDQAEAGATVLVCLNDTVGTLAAGRYALNSIAPDFRHKIKESEVSFLILQYRAISWDFY